MSRIDAQMGDIAARYGREVDPMSVPRLAQQHGLVLS